MRVGSNTRHDKHPKRLKRKASRSLAPKSNKGVLGKEHWDQMERRRVKARMQDKSPKEDFVIRVYLKSRRGRWIYFKDTSGKCSNCYQHRYHLKRYKESNLGVVLLCEKCEAPIYENSHGTGSFDAMHKAVYRKRSRG